MNSKNTKSAIKFFVFAIIILGGYYATKVTPVKVKRMNTATENFKTIDSFSFSGTAVLEETRSGFYDLQIEGRKNGKKVAGNFDLETEISRNIQKINGEFIIDGSDMYLNFNDDGLPIALENFFMDNYEIPIERARSNWVLLCINQDFELNFLDEEVESISQSGKSEDKEEKFSEIETFTYKMPIKINDLFESEIPVEFWIGKKNLNIYKLKIDESLELAKNYNFKDPFVDLPMGITPTVKVEFNFSDFQKSEEIILPEDFLEL